ncbi:glycosyltransferase family 2 protein [Desulfopila sp. IMCC35006]|uniref:glycosyltransferase family 2 protein n=1 Tax=Desulfopila sp. IMCC35006 TaxID=2569542 RepID=UPI0010AD6CAF|nr:glycosyltransferase family 2 protein [Desulfopila sp. IMCC35006]TKB23973.1 glycosyltransferase family 2 protein [Desulfopila sp. IMCC35006]
MNSDPLVSVIIPAYNAASYIEETIRSITNQTYKNLEIIVVDDGSTDQTSEVVTRFASKVHYCYQPNSGGAAVPRNKGIDYSQGILICFMDADDLMPPDRIRLQVDFLKRHPEVGLVFSDYINFNEKGLFEESHFRSCPKFQKVLNDRDEIVMANSCIYLILENFGITGSLMFRRELLEIVNGFETTLNACEDFHFYYMLARNTKTGIINNIGMLRRFHGDNMTSNSLLMLTEGIASRSMLRKEEKNPRAIKLLDEYIGNCWSSISRLQANQGRYAQAVRDEFRALCSDLSFRRLQTSTKNFIRTFMMTLRLHKERGN